MIGKFIQRYNQETENKCKFIFIVPKNKIKKSRYLGNIILNNQLHKADDEGYDGMFIIEIKKIPKLNGGGRKTRKRKKN